MTSFAQFAVAGALVMLTRTVARLGETELLLVEFGPSIKLNSRVRTCLDDNGEVLAEARRALRGMR
jgi:hypothetical protein